MRKSFRLGTLLSLVTSIGAPVMAQDQADEAFVAESLPDHLLYLFKNSSAAPEDAGAQLLADKKTWEAGDQLKVCFFGGNQVVRTLVASVASQWNAHSSITFDFGQPGVWRDCMNAKSGFSQIRIGFGDRGYWSAIGTDSNNLLNARQPSMNLGGFDIRYGPHMMSKTGQLYTLENVAGSAAFYDRGVILHEFGHALGLMHEHQNPNLNCFDEIRWQGEKNVYDYYSGDPNYWDPEKVDFNVGKNGFSEISIKAGEPDPKSIMMYAQPAAIFKSGTSSRCYVQQNNALSELDKQFIAEIYPLGSGAPDEHFGSSTLPALSAAMASSPDGQKDIIERVNVDLLSDVTSVRREARRQLASLLQASQSPQLALDLIKASENKSYRQQLGVAAALGNTTLPFGSKPAIKAEILQRLSSIGNANRDPSLAQSLSRAASAVNGQIN